MKLRNKFISLFLAIVSVFTFATTALASPTRKTDEVNYLSEVAVIEAKSLDEAKKVFEELKKEKNGSFTGLIETDLNEGGENKIYLAYKTSTNVDDAITDLSVMNMNGNFSVGNYEKLYAETLETYMSIAADYVIMAEEFRANYKAGYTKTKIAHRQMNYYYVEQGGKKIYMGDYMLNFTEAKKAEFAELLFKGNIKIIANVRSLMAMGIGKADDTLSSRIEKAYKEAETNISIYEIAEYKESASGILGVINEMLDNLKSIPEKIKAEQSTAVDSSDGTAESFEVLSLKETLKTAQALMLSLQSIKMGDTNLGDFLASKSKIEEKDLYPIVHAGTKAEKTLMEYGAIHSLLLYDGIGSNIDIVNTELEKFEENFTPISVFHGVQNDISAGSIGVTGKATSVTASTGKSFFDLYKGENLTGKTVLYTSIGVAGIILTTVGSIYLYTKEKTAKFIYNDLVAAIKEAKEAVQAKGEIATLISKANCNFKKTLVFRGKTYTIDEALSSSVYNTQYGEIDITILSNRLKRLPKHITWGKAVFGGAMVTLGVFCMALSIYEMIDIYKEYEVSYTKIPDNMVDVVSDDVNGDRFINYKNVPSYRMDGEALKKRNNDLNGYNGKEWVSLYYTKNSEAGKCLTASADFVASETARDGYSPVHLFGHNSNYNLNSYCNRKDATEIYLAFKYSENQKTAQTDVPDIINS